MNSRHSSSIYIIHQQNSIFKKIKNRPITSFKRTNGMKRPNTTFNKRKIRPKTALNSSMNYKKLENNNSKFIDSIINIPTKIKNKFGDKIKKDYIYKNEFKTNNNNYKNSKIMNH
jgi:hypothetical protein